MDKLKRLSKISVGYCCLAIGILFILLPGPAVIFLPLGLALLSTEYFWAQRWLKKCQRWMRTSAEKLDRFFVKMRR
ncbi:PGPGW domain-containing protein [Thalassotalea ganghwensis]